jgi:hypothetical protein
MLIEQMPLPSNDAVLSRSRAAHGQHLNRQIQRVAGPHRRRPFDVLESRRAARVGVAKNMIDHQAHGDTASVPAAGNESMPLPLLRRNFVDVKGLRIEFRREIDDRRFVDVVGAGPKNLAFEKIGEFHDRCTQNPLLARVSPARAPGWYHGIMPLAAKNNLDELYARHRLLQDEAARLQSERDRLDPDGPDADRRYILDVESRALLEEATILGSSISDILERDLQR